MTWCLRLWYKLEWPLCLILTHRVRILDQVWWQMVLKPHTHYFIKLTNSNHFCFWGCLKWWRGWAHNYCMPQGILSLILFIHKKFALWLFLCVILALCVVVKRKKIEQQNKRRTKNYSLAYYPSAWWSWGYTCTDSFPPHVGWCLWCLVGVLGS